MIYKESKAPAKHCCINVLQVLFVLDDVPMKMGSDWKETRNMYGTKAPEHFEVL